MLYGVWNDFREALEKKITLTKVRYEITFTPPIMYSFNLPCWTVFFINLDKYSSLLYKQLQ